MTLALAPMPGGTLVGTLIHGVMERVDFETATSPAAVDAALGHELAYYNVDLGRRDDVVRGLCAAIDARWARPSALRLRDVARGQRLDELGFELPLVGGDHAKARLDGDLRVSDLATLLVEHLEPPILSSPTPTGCATPRSGTIRCGAT